MRLFLLVLHRQHFVCRWGEKLTLPAFGLYRLNGALGESVGLMMINEEERGRHQAYGVKGKFVEILLW